MHHLKEHKKKGYRALILAPTRELAKQVNCYKVPSPELAKQVNCYKIPSPELTFLKCHRLQAQN
jgi:hypothetical protein